MRYDMDRFPERATRPTLSTPERKETEAPVREQPAVPRAPQNRPQAKADKSLTKKALLIVAGLVVVALLVWWFFLRNLGVPSYIDTSKYQVACLQSGECYFGKVTSVTSDTMQIKNVFYVQKSTGSGSTSGSSADTSNNLQLIKLGNEVHGPEDMMIINRSQVLYVENLKSDGKVTQTINSYYQQNKN